MFNNYAVAHTSTCSALSIVIDNINMVGDQAGHSRADQSEARGEYDQGDMINDFSRKNIFVIKLYIFLKLGYIY